MRPIRYAALLAAALLCGCAALQPYPDFTTDGGKTVPSRPHRLYGLRMGAASPGPVQAPVEINCIQATSTPCSSASHIGSGNEGIPAYLAFGELNDWGLQLGLFANQPANEVEATPNGAPGIPGPRALVNADFPASGVAPGSYTSANITVNAQGIVTAAANGTGGGGGSVSSFSFTNGNGFTGVVTGSTTTPALSLSLALTGDCATSGASITCTKTNGTAFSALATTVPGTGVAAFLATPTLANLDSAISATLASISGAIVTGHCAEWASSTTLEDAGAACGSGGSGITQLTGDVTAGPGSGSQVATLAASGVTPGSYNSANITVDAKGRVTAAANGTASAGTITPGTTTVTGAAAPCLIENSSGTTMSCAPLGNGLGTSNGSVGTSTPPITYTASHTVASADMGVPIFMNVTGGGTLTITAISSTVFANGMGTVVTNYSGSTLAVSTTPTINSGGGCVVGTGIPTQDTWFLFSNGTTLDCFQVAPTSSGGSTFQVNGTTLISSSPINFQNSTTTLGGITLSFTNPSGGIIKLSATGSVGVANGGTNLTSMTAHGVLIGEGASNPAFVGPGTSGLPLLGAGASADPAFGPMSLSALAAQGADTIVANSTASSAGPAAVAIGAEMMAYLQATTTFAIAGTGCTPSAHSGSAFGGKFTVAAGPCTAVTITMNGATGFTDSGGGYHCNVSDDSLQGAGTWFGEWGASSYTPTTATLPIPGAAGATDTFSFTCKPFGLQ